jgi:hypothetical protein
MTSILSVIGIVVTTLVLGPGGMSPSAWAQQKSEKSFHAVLTDSQGVETEVKNVIFYWEEKISETAFVPHELRHIPVKRGTTTVNVKFETIKVIEVKPSQDTKALPTLVVTLTNGKTGEFALAIDGKFKGESDFGEIELPATSLKRIVFK